MPYLPLYMLIWEVWENQHELQNPVADRSEDGAHRSALPEIKVLAEGDGILPSDGISSPAEPAQLGGRN